MGYHSAKFFEEGGALVVGLIEYEGAIYNEAGLDVEAVFNTEKNRIDIEFPWCKEF